ncbi:MAG: histidine kinase [Bacteroidetes bacterium]|nr:histidine kinase [Bacteroidota bacterium]
MKRIIIILATAFFLLNLISQGQESRFPIFPENGMQYLYEFTEINYIQNKGKETKDTLIKHKLLSIQYGNFKPEDKTYLLVKVVENTVEKPQQNITNFKDYRFPEFKDGFYDKRYRDFYEDLLCRIDFKYDFDIENGNVKLLNREDVLLDVRKILKEKGFGENEIKKRMTIFNKEAIPKITQYLESIYHVSGEFLEEDLPNVPVYDGKIEVRNSILKITQKKLDIEVGLYMRNVSINNEKKCLLDLHTIELDSLKYPRKIQNIQYQFSAVEKRIQLKQVKEIGLNRFIISGTIENPESKMVTLAILKNAFGIEMHKETVFLDDNNSFQIDIELNHAGFVFLQFGRNNNYDKRAFLSFYAEPGSEIHFDAKGELFPWEIEFSGDLIGASNLLYDLRKNTKIFDQRIDFNTLQNRRYKTNYEDFMQAYNEFDSFSKKYKIQLDEYAFEFISNEITAYFLGGVVDYLDRLNFSVSSSFGTMIYPGIENANRVELEKILNLYDIHKIYNEYGIYSRLLARDYLQHNFTKIKKVKEHIFRDYQISGINVDFHYSSDIVQRVELARTVLTGYPLYSELMKIFVTEIGREERFLSQDKNYILQQIDNYMDLMIRLCNDEEFVDEIKEVRKNYLQWQGDNYVPETKFYNQNGEQKYFKDFFVDKPTVFYVSFRWAQGRYYWDNLAEDNPELNVVMVTEGSNFKEWTDYVERATPVAKQLFLVNHELKLNNVFLKNAQHYIAYDKTGKLIGFAETADEIIKIGKQSLVLKKKELNKSQLQIIVIILISILTILIMGLLIWKWWVRQRFRKEQQFRKQRELELTAIRSQMNPHFLFNSLNSVQNLVQQNKGREAHLYLSDFAGLIRKVLRNSEKEEVSLAEELEMVEQYLNLEKLRFNFNFSISVDKELDPHNTLVPSMLLQPFAENAVIHGLQSKPENRQLSIIIQQVESGIKISIEDNGIGREEAKKIAKAKNGKGSKMIQERLNILQEKQGEKYQLDIIDLNENGETGTRVEILIPEEK